MSITKPPPIAPCIVYLLVNLLFFTTLLTSNIPLFFISFILSLFKYSLSFTSLTSSKFDYVFIFCSSIKQCGGIKYHSFVINSITEFSGNKPCLT